MTQTQHHWRAQPCTVCNTTTETRDDAIAICLPCSEKNTSAWRDYRENQYREDLNCQRCGLWSSNALARLQLCDRCIQGSQLILVDPLACPPTATAIFPDATYAS